MTTQDLRNRWVVCPNNHPNPEGSDWCGICSLPILDCDEELELLLKTLAGQGQHVGLGRRNLFLGVGDQGQRLVHDFYQRWGGRLRDSEFLLLELPGVTPQRVDAGCEAAPISMNGHSSLSRYHLSGASGREVDCFGVGERLVSSDPGLTDRLLRSGAGVSIGNQTMFMLMALGGGMASGAGPRILAQAKSLSHQGNSLVIAMMPGNSDLARVHFAAYCSLSRLIKCDGTPPADMILLVDHDRLVLARGVGSGRTEVVGESILSYLLAMLVGVTADRNSGLADASYLAEMSRAMGIRSFTPCVAVGRSLEIFGSLTNILESAVSFPLGHVDKESVVLSLALAQVPEGLTTPLQEEALNDEFNKWNRASFPHLKESVLQIAPSGEQSDRVSLCLLLGGTKLAVAAQRTGSGYATFRALLEKGGWDQRFCATPKDLSEVEEAIDSYDNNLDEMRG
ncbi:MAG: hypothetical protein V3R87_05750 [Dehalococcoidia bacterium]